MYRTIGNRVGDAVRLAEVFQILARHGFAGLLRRAGMYEGLPARILRKVGIIKQAPATPETVGERLCAALSDLGPTFVKFGQILSTRPDLVSKDISLALQELQDRVPPVPFDTIKPQIEDSLGRPLEEVFAHFEPVPDAAASLSQVHRATLRDGTFVAVKVRRPGAVATVEADVRLMRTMAEWAAEHMHDIRWIDPVGTVEEFRKSVRRELDFSIEARTMERFAAHYAGDACVEVPTVYSEYTSPSLIVMDWLDGDRVDRIDAFPERRSDPKEVARRGCDTLCKQVFIFHLFHADPHAGNVKLLMNNRIAFLDYGMVGHLERTDVVAIADLLRAIFQEDAQRFVDSAQTFLQNPQPEQLEALRNEVGDYLALEATAIVGQGEVGKAIDRVTMLLRRHHLQLAPRFSLLLKALVTVESTGHLLDPQLNMVPIIRPYVERILTDRFSPQELVHEGWRGAELLVRMMRDVPSETHALLRTLRSGNLTVQLHHEKLDQLSNVTDRASNRVTFGLITGAIIVGSSLLLGADVGLRPIGIGGYLIAGILGLGLVVSIIRSRNI